MDPERWRLIEELYHTALEREPAARAALLAAAEPSIRREVEKLLAQESADGVLDSPAAEAARELGLISLAPGTELGPYRIEARIGAGGMGEVFRAADTRLHRTVAIKILLRDQVADPARKRRFLQEARAVSALNHPHICALYDIGSQDGIDFLVLEWLEGETLEARLRKGPLPAAQFFEYAAQVADALDQAHQRGLIHRDLKPANIMLTKSGAKLLDFGLAKTVRAAAATDARTVTSLTEAGAILGTFQYMAPEQLQGKDADARADIFALGAVLYEMATRRKAFTGENQAALISSIMTADPPPAPGALSPAVDHVIRRALAKDPAERWQTVRDLLLELKWAAAAAPAVAARPQSPLRRRARWLLAGLVLLLAAGGGAYWFSRAKETPPATLEAVPLTTYPGYEWSPSFSPDGNQVAFSWNGEKQDNYDIYVKLIAPGRPLRLTTDPADDVGPTWSPDGASIAFVRMANGKPRLMLISALGGPERELVAWQGSYNVSPIFVNMPAPGGAAYYYQGLTTPNWSPDGRWLVAAGRDSMQKPIALWLVSLESGEKRQLTVPPAGNWGDFCAAFSPDGRSVAFARYTALPVSDIYVLPLAGNLSAKGEPNRLTNDKRFIGGLAWTADGREIVFSSNRGGPTALWRVTASGGGDPRRLAVGQDGLFPAISRQGNRLVYGQSITDTNIWRVNIANPHEPPTRLIASTRLDALPQYSPDGKSILFTSGRSGNFAVWVCDADGSNPRQLVAMGFSASARWAPDSQHIVFDSNDEGHYQVYEVSAQGGRPRRVTTSAANDVRPSWSHDGKWIYFASNRGGGQTEQVWKIPAGGGEPIQVTRNGGSNPMESPDGSWLYYSRVENGVSPLLKMPAAGGDETQVLDAVEGRAFVVATRGIYFLLRSSLQYYDFAAAASRPVKTDKAPSNSYLTVSPDGRWLLYTQVDQGGSDLMRVDHFR